MRMRMHMRMRMPGDHADRAEAAALRAGHVDRLGRGPPQGGRHLLPLTYH